MTDVQQAVPVAQEYPASAIGALTGHQRQIDSDGTFVGVSRQALDEVIAWAETRRPSLPCKSGEGAGSMKPWRGGDSAPSDWNGGPVVMVDPSDLSGDAFVEVNVPPREMPWKRTVGWKVIVAYTPIPDATQTREAEAVALVQEMADPDLQDVSISLHRTWQKQALRIAALNARVGA
jgi:hypothetical protein